MLHPPLVQIKKLRSSLLPVVPGANFSTLALCCISLSTGSKTEQWYEGEIDGIYLFVCHAEFLVFLQGPERGIYGIQFSQLCYGTGEAKREGENVACSRLLHELYEVKI